MTCSRLISVKMDCGAANTNHICVDCSRQFIDRYDPPKGYSDAVKRECLKMYVNGMGFRGIERVNVLVSA